MISRHVSGNIRTARLPTKVVQMPQPTAVSAGSKSPHHLLDILHLRWRGETMAHQLTPFGEVRRAAEVHGVVLHRLPFDEQPIARRLLTVSPPHAGRALRRSTQRFSLGKEQPG